MMNNIITSGANEICNNNNNPSVVTFVGLDDNNQKQFTNWETNNDHIPTNNNLNPNFINNPTTTNTIFDTYNSSSSSSSSTFASNNFISSNYSHFPNYPSSSFFKKHELDENGSIPFYNNNSSTTTTSSSSNFDRRIGLNLGHRTYFSSTETTSSIIDPLSRKPRGGGFYFENHHHHQVPRCQAEGCMIDLSNAKHYHRRHKVCEFHSKATMVVAGGIEQRFCQQCSRFHVLAEFDESKRSCRKRLADHNRRRRKPHNQPSAPSDHSQLPPPSENATMSNKMGSSTSRSEVVIQERPSTSSNLSLMISKCSNNNNKQIQTSTSKDNLMIMSDNFMVSSSSPLQHQAFPLGVDDQVDDKQHLNSSTHYHDRSRPFISSTKTHDESMSTSLFIQRSSDENLFFSNANNSHEDCGSDRDNQNHNHNQEEDLHNLLQLGQSMFDVEFV